MNGFDENPHADSLAAQLARHLRRDILRGKLKPGDTIKERDNAAELGVSRTPMREAIRILAQEGLVILRPARSPVVANPSYRDVADQVRVLLSLEKLSAELACTAASDAELDELAAIRDFMAEHFDTMDPLDMFERDMEFHATIARITHNKALIELHTWIMQRLWRTRYLSAIQRRNRDRVISQHSAVLDALRTRDPQAAVAAIEAHLGSLGDDIGLAFEDEREGGADASTDDGTDDLTA
ncbi:GntR family transcriptional regulator [Celeribacter sp.]|uniref:GntR family transcriptional regulator n=1 Tax=Celeribacter sp. TaxID=1890673 RepID=UPI003A90DAA0